MKQVQKGELENERKCREEAEGLSSLSEGLSVLLFDSLAGKCLALARGVSGSAHGQYHHKPCNSAPEWPYLEKATLCSHKVNIHMVSEFLSLCFPPYKGGLQRFLQNAYYEKIVPGFSNFLIPK